MSDVVNRHRLNPQISNTAANLRSVASKNFIVPQAKCNLFKGCLSYSGVIVWNSILSVSKPRRLYLFSLRNVLNGLNIEYIH